MRGRLPVMLIALVALALTLSLVAALAPNASAQDIPNPTGEQDSWVRLNVPAAQDLRAAPAGSGVSIPARNCAITLRGPVETAVINPGSTNCIDVLDRWFCFGGFY